MAKSIDPTGSGVGVLNEIGDMGLGFDPLNKQDQQAYQEATKENEEKKDK